MNHRFYQFTSGISTIYKNLQKVKTQEMKELNLKGSHVMCLYRLGNSEIPLTLTQLSILNNEDKAATSRTISDLVERAYVSIDSEQKYRAPIQLTPAGLKAYEQLDEIVFNAVIAGGKGLTDDERDVFYRALKIISDNLAEYIKK